MERVEWQGVIAGLAEARLTGTRMNCANSNFELAGITQQELTKPNTCVKIDHIGWLIDWHANKE